MDNLYRTPCKKLPYFHFPIVLIIVVVLLFSLLCSSLLLKMNSNPIKIYLLLFIAHFLSCFFFISYFFFSSIVLCSLYDIPLVALFLSTFLDNNVCFHVDEFCLKISVIDSQLSNYWRIKSVSYTTCIKSPLTDDQCQLLLPTLTHLELPMMLFLFLCLLQCSTLLKWVTWYPHSNC